MSGILNILVALKEAVLVDARDLLARDWSKSGSGGSSTVSVTFNSSGACTQTGLTATSPGTYTWLLAGAASDFEIYYAHTGATLAAGSAAINTWLSLGTTRTWSLTQVNSSNVAGGTYSIRYAGSGTVMDTGTISLDVDSVP